MRSFEVTVVNEEFRSSYEQEWADEHSAKRQALKGALEIGSEQIVAGKPFFAAEVTVRDGKTSERFIVSLGASRLA